MSDVPKQPMTMERLNLIEALLTAKLFPNGGYAETRELIEAVRALQQRSECQYETLDYLRDHELYCCPDCGYIDADDPANGFWEKGCNEAGEDVHDCDGCGKRVVIRPAKLSDLQARARLIFDAGFRTCAGYGDNRAHYRGEQADRVFAKSMVKLVPCHNLPGVTDGK